MNIPRLAILTVLCSAPSFAGSVVENTTPPTVGVPYHWVVNLVADDMASMSRHVGAWSWEDNSLFDPGLGEPPVGWTHTSDWVALTLAQPAFLTLRLERDPNVSLPTPLDPLHLAPVNSMFPSFTIWSGLDEDTDQLHTYNNHGNVSWAEDISFLDYLDNSTLTSAERTWTLPAGNYTIALGSNAPATDPERQGYRATFTTQPVPEPGTVTLLAGAVALVGLRCRRRMKASRP
jgi:hypothetical protein